MRPICVVALSLTIGLILVAADEPQARAQPSREAELKALRKKLDSELADLKKRRDATRDPSELNGIREEEREAIILAVRDILEIARANPKDATGFEAAAFVLESAGKYGGGKEFDTASTLIAEHHMNNPKIKDFLPLMANGPAGQKFLQTALEKSTDKDVKGIALFYLGVSVRRQLDNEEDDKKIDELASLASRYLQKAAKDCPETEVGSSTIAKAAEVQLEAIRAIANLAVGKAVPPIEGTNLDGKKVKLTSYKGKVVLVDIWATWCGPCRAMIPHEREMVKKLKGKPFALLSVSCDNDWETLVKFFENEPMPWDHWFDGADSSVSKSFRVRAFPTLYLIDHAGVIRNKWIGSPGNDKLDKAVEELVAEAEKSKG